MPRTKEQAETWDEARRLARAPESLRCREPHKCYDCGATLVVGPCGGWHERLIEDRRYGYAVAFCCACANLGGACHAEVQRN